MRGNEPDRGGRARRLRQHRLDRRLRRADRPGRLRRLEGRHRRPDAAGGARHGVARASASSRSPPDSSTRRCSPPCPRRHATALGAGIPFPPRLGRPAEYAAPGRRRSSRTRCSTARRSASTARCGCRRSDAGRGDRRCLPGAFAFHRTPGHAPRRHRGRPMPFLCSHSWSRW